MELENGDKDNTQYQDLTHSAQSARRTTTNNFHAISSKYFCLKLVSSMTWLSGHTHIFPASSREFCALRPGYGADNEERAEHRS